MKSIHRALTRISRQACRSFEFRLCNREPAGRPRRSLEVRLPPSTIIIVYVQLVMDAHLLGHSFSLCPGFSWMTSRHKIHAESEVNLDHNMLLIMTPIPAVMVFGIWPVRRDVHGRTFAQVNSIDGFI